MKVRNIAKENAEAYERAFGNMPKKNLTSEFYVHKKVASFIRDTWPEVRFYSTLDGFNLGNQRTYVNSIQWGEPGVPDLFIFKRTAKHTFLAIEIKKDGEKTSGSEHLKRQAGWLKYLETQGAKAVFGVGYNECITIIKNYLK